MLRKFKILFVILMMVFGVACSWNIVHRQQDVVAQASAPIDPPEQVVLLHGILKSSAQMRSLEAFLTNQGYRVFNIDYPSTENDLAALAVLVSQELAQKLDPEHKVHFIGYSMGGLLARAIITHDRPLYLGRVVQLASPNQGSEVADFLKNNFLYHYFYGPAGQQLVTKNAGTTEILGVVDYELGVVAGSFTLDPLSSWIIPGPDDGKVSIESTKVTGMQDHIVVSASHLRFPYNRIVQKQALAFLKEGRFTHP